MSVAATKRAAGDEPAVRSVGRVAVGSLMASLCAYLLHIPAGRWLAPGGYGEFAVLLQVILLLSVPAAALQAVTAREIVRGRDPQSVLRAGIWTTVLVAGCAALAVAPIVTLTHTGIAATIAAVASAPLLVMIALAQGVYQGRSEFTRLAWVIAAVGLIRSVPAVIGLAFVRSPAAAFIGLALGALVAAVVVGMPVVVGLRSARSDSVRNIRAGTGAVLHASQVQLVLVGLTSVDLLLARPVLGAGAAGLFALGTIATRVAFWLPQAVGVVFFPRMADLNRSARALRTAVVVVVSIGIAVTLAAAAGAPVVALIFGDAYRPVTGWLWLFAITGTAQAVLQVALLAAIARERTWISLWAWATAVVEATLALTVVHSVLGLAVVSVSCSLIAAVATLVAGVRTGVTSRT